MEPKQQANMTPAKSIISAIADVLGEAPTDLDMEASLREDLSLNPVQMADLYNELSEKFGLVFVPSETDTVQTVEDLVELVEDKLLES